MSVDTLFNSVFCLLYPDYRDRHKNIYDNLLESDSILKEVDILDCCRDNLSAAIEFLKMGVDEDLTNLCSFLWL